MFALFLTVVKFSVLYTVLCIVIAVLYVTLEITFAKLKQVRVERIGY